MGHRRRGVVMLHFMDQVLIYGARCELLFQVLVQHVMRGAMHESARQASASFGMKEWSRAIDLAQSKIA